MSRDEIIARELEEAIFALARGNGDAAVGWIESAIAILRPAASLPSDQKPQ